MRITAITVILFFNYLGLTQNADIGLSIGGSNYSGDLTESIAISLKQTHTCYAIHAGMELDPVISLKLQYMFLGISGDDRYSTRQGNKDRKLNFESDVHELNLSAQMYFMSLWRESISRWNPFLQLGFSVFKFNPTTQYQGIQVELQALGTEGQGLVNYPEKYSLVNVAFAMGLGLRYYMNSRYSVTLDALLRQTNSDYLDDASTNYVSYETLLQNKGRIAADLGNKISATTGTKRANPGDKDWYQSVVFTLSYHFGKSYKFNSPSRRKNQILCPHF